MKPPKGKGDMEPIKILRNPGVVRGTQKTCFFVFFGPRPASVGLVCKL